MTVVITDTNALSIFCDRLMSEPFITVDTEFIRERTYYPQVCLIQVGGGEDAMAIDPLADGISLEPLFALMRHKTTIKVFHAGSQDLEIFYQLMGDLPAPVYDTQIAAMVCGFGDQVGYESLVNQLCNVQIDKSQRFTDWSHRPLKDAQLDYAIADVTHLRDVYTKLLTHIETHKRQAWIEEELANLCDPDRYVTHPEDAWLKMKIRERRPRYLARLRALAQWREEEAIRQNKPRGWIINDDALQEIAQTNPITEQALRRVRMIKKHLNKLDLSLLLLLIEGANTLPTNQCPRVPQRKQLPSELDGSKDLLKVLLKLKCQEHNVAPRLVASADELNLLLLGEPHIPYMKGWRYEVFGKDAEALLAGQVHMAVDEARNVMLTPATSP